MTSIVDHAFGCDYRLPVDEGNRLFQSKSVIAGVIETRNGRFNRNSPFDDGYFHTFLTIFGLDFQGCRHTLEKGK